MVILSRRVWIDRGDSQVGAHYRQTICDAIDVCDACILLMSPPPYAGTMGRSRPSYNELIGRWVGVIGISHHQVSVAPTVDAVGVIHHGIDVDQPDPTIERAVDRGPTLRYPERQHRHNNPVIGGG